MKGFLVSAVAVLLVVACGGGTAAQSSPPGPLIKYKNALSGLNATGKIDLVQNVIDFAPGAASVVHTHSTPNLATVLQGAITVKLPTGEKQASVGQMLVEPINEPLQAVNSGSVETLVLVAFAVPHGTKPTAPVAGKPAPATPNKTLYTFTMVGSGVSGPYGFVQQELDFAPGSQTPKVGYGGPGVFTVLKGQITLTADGVERTAYPGDTFTELPFQTVQLVNHGTADVVLVATFMLPDGAKLMKTQ